MPVKLEEFFEKIADYVSKIVGSPAWFFFSIVVILIWFPSGFFFGFDELWHLFINTFTTILTFLMMALLHSSQDKWEKDIEQLQKKQERTLKLLERETKQLRSDLGSNSEANSNNNQEKAEENDDEKPGLNQSSNSITSLL